MQANISVLVINKYITEQQGRGGEDGVGQLDHEPGLNFGDVSRHVAKLLQKKTKSEILSLRCICWERHLQDTENNNRFL